MHIFGIVYGGALFVVCSGLVGYFFSKKRTGMAMFYLALTWINGGIFVCSLFGGK
jgi:Gpi18-like mannosyltransferase